MIFHIAPAIRLELITTNHAQQVFDVVNQNRKHLRTWLPFVDKMQTVAFAEHATQLNVQRNKEGLEYAFVIMENETLIGRIGIYRIDLQNKIGEIGYWLVEAAQGKGIITLSCITLINFGFDELQLNRIEIKCGTENHPSKAIPEKLNFTKEAVIRQGEWVQGAFIDLNLYSLVKSDKHTK